MSRNAAFSIVFLLFFMAGAFCLCAQEVNCAVDSSFKPVCVEASLSSREVRPGGRFTLSIVFRNEGTAPASLKCNVFTHIEHPEKNCANIVIHADHQPTVPTTDWLPGETVVDGPHLLEFPANAPEGTYYVHVGVFAPGLRLCEKYIAEIIVSKDAPQVRAVPPKMPQSEVAARRKALESRMGDALVLKDDHLRFEVSRETGVWVLTDNATGEKWHSNPERDGLGQVQFTNGRESVTEWMGSFADARRKGNEITLKYSSEAADSDLSLEIGVRLLPKEQGLHFSYSESSRGDWRVDSIRLLDNALWATDTEQGYFAVPNRLGILFPAAEGLPHTSRYLAYRNSKAYSMAMLGAVKNGSALLLHWDDPYTVLETRRAWLDNPIAPGRGMVAASLTLSKSAKSFVVNPLGRGGYAEVAHAYREVVRERGLLETWEQKIARNPNAEKLLGAADFKPFVLMRLVPNTRVNKSPNEKTSVSYTFDEAAQVAEHLRHDLGIERAMYVLAGWIRRGYDNQHPDILPAAPECGGNDALADCADRVKSLGYLFGLHDNYQDMYKDAPSWDESYIMKRPDGSLHPGGEWAGGRAYLTCSKKALELAKRPQNLPEVSRLFDPTIYFIDTTFAAPPFECFDPEHPLTLNDDIRWKTALSEYSREVFGLFGSEEGQEWGVPCADYFEGLMSQKTRHAEGEIVIPLFEMVFGDCINLYAHQGDRAAPDRPSYVLDHILYAQMSIYQLSPHLYFNNNDENRLQVEPSVHSVKQTGPRKFEITYAWKAVATPKVDCSTFVHFVDRKSGGSEGIVFQNDHQFATPMTSWKPGETVLDGPYTVEAPEDGTFEVMVGLLDASGQRMPMIGAESQGSRYPIGTLSVSEGEVEFRPFVDSRNPMLCFSRQEGEYASLNRTDRFIKNTYEILSPLNRVTAYTPMTAHEFVTPDRKVERTRFGDVEITVNYGKKPYRAGNAVLPQYGFIVESPTYVAFHAVEYAGHKLSEPTMAVVNSLDGKPLAQSADVKTYRAFGENRVRIAGREFEF